MAMRLRSVAKPQYLFKPARALARMFRVQHRDRHQAVEVSLPWGVSIEVDTGETIGRSIWRAGVHDLPVVEAIWRLLDAADSAVDIGANIGYVTSAMAARVGRGGRVVAFEPHPTVYADLRRNIERFQRHASLGEVVAHQIALGDRDGEATLVCGADFASNKGASRIGERSGPSHAVDPTHVPVTIRQLDEYIADSNIALVKIDVEGHELAVLRGGARALAEGRVASIIYEDLTGRDGAVHEALRGYGYSLFALGWTTHKPVLTTLEQGPSIDLSWESPNYLATRTPADAVGRFRRWGWSVI